MSGATGYKLLYGSTSRVYGLSPINLGNVTSKVFTGVSIGTYYLAVMASNGTDSSPYSDEQKIGIEILGLSVPTSFTASASGSSARLSWGTASGATGYKLYYGTTSGTYLGSLDLGNVTSKNITGVPKGTYYLVLLRQINGYF